MWLRLKLRPEFHWRSVAMQNCVIDSPRLFHSQAEFAGNSSIPRTAPWNCGGFFVSFPILRGICIGKLNRRDFLMSELIADPQHGPRERVAQLVEQRTFNP